MEGNEFEGNELSNILQNSSLARKKPPANFEPGQAQRIKSGLKTHFNLSHKYSAHILSNHIFPPIYKISPDTNS